MISGTSTGRKPRRNTVDSFAQKPADSPDTDYRLRCPDCDFSKRFETYAEAATHQGRHGCRNCDRLLGLTEVPARQSDDSLDAAEAVAAAEHERHQLLRDGRAPTTTEILRAMGRDTDGFPVDYRDGAPTAREAIDQLLSSEADRE